MLDIDRMREVNGRYFGTYSNGGLGKAPNLILDSSIDTDAVAARIMDYPSMKGKSQYFDQDSDFYRFQRNRLETGFASVPGLHERGMNIAGMDAYGRVNRLAVQPNMTLALSSADSQTSWLLGAIVITGFVILVLNAIAPQ